MTSFERRNSKRYLLFSFYIRFKIIFGFFIFSFTEQYGMEEEIEPLESNAAAASDCVAQ